VEDQPLDSGDLTTDATAATDEATDAKAARRRHRMPLRQELAAGGEDNTPAPADETTDAAGETAQTTAESVDPMPEPAPPRRRWRFLRRRSKTPEVPADESVPATGESTQAEEPKPAPRTPVGKAGRSARPVAEQEPASDEAPVDEAADADAQAEETSDATEGEQILVPHRPAGRRLKMAAVAAGVLFVGAAAFAGATVQPYLADRAIVHTKLDVARTAANAITTLWTYTPDNMDSLPDRSARYLGGDFATEYRKYIDAIVAPNKQAQVTNTTQVMGTAVETLTGSEATAIVYTNSVATSPVTKNIPSLRYLSYRLTLERRKATWLITHMSTVTSLDLTPQL
jgi:Mce-associated membrane protein